MRFAVATLVGAVAVFAGWSAPGASGLNQQEQAQVVTVTVNVQCSADEVVTSVNPERVRVRQGGEVRWVLADDAESETISITPKEQGRWPFARMRAGGRGAENAARADQMRPDQASERPYPYNVHVQCGGEDITIDPDIIVF